MGDVSISVPAVSPHGHRFFQWYPYCYWKYSLLSDLYINVLHFISVFDRTGCFQQQYF